MTLIVSAFAGITLGEGSVLQAWDECADTLPADNLARICGEFDASIGRAGILLT